MRLSATIYYILFFAFFGGMITSGAFGLEHADWARNGQPIVERWLDELRHSIPGASIGAMIGLFVGLLAPNLLESSGVDRFVEFMEIDKKSERAIQFIALLIVIPLSFIANNGYVQIGIVFAVYFSVHYYFKSNKTN